MFLLLGTPAWVLSQPPAYDQPDQAPTAAPQIGFRAPGFSLPRTDGSQTSLSELRGHVVVLNLWASWCPPCRAEMPTLQRAYQEYRDQGLEILAINTTFQDSPQSALDFAGDLGLTFPILLDESGDVSRSYQLRALPSTFFIDREGIVRRVVLGGPMSEDTITSTLDTLIPGIP